MGDSLEAKIERWMKEQGYPLEMEVAAALGQTGRQVVQSSHYRDPETGKSREIDVLCLDWDSYGVYEATVAVECKVTKRPWLLLTNEGSVAFNAFFALGFTSDKARKALIAHGHKKVESLFPWIWSKDRVVAYGITEAFTSSRDVPYWATMGALSAAWVQLLPRDDGRTLRALRIAFPVVVTGSPLFECSLNGEGNLDIKRVSEGWLYSNAEPLGCPPTCVRIVSADGIQDFSEDVDRVLKGLQELLAPDIEKAIEEFEKGLRMPRSDDTEG